MINIADTDVLIVELHPLFGDGGGRYASRAFINAFAQIAKSVTVLYENSGAPEKLNPNVTIEPVAKQSTYVRGSRLIFRGIPHPFVPKFKQLMQLNKYKLVVFDNSRVSYQLIDIAQKAGSKVVTIHHNYEYEFLRDAASATLKKPFLLRAAQKAECNAVRKSDLNICLTQTDCQILKQVYAPNINVNIESVGMFEYQQNTIENLENYQSDYFVLTGNLRAKQTNDSINEFKPYLAQLKKNVPNLKLRMAGKNPRADLIKYCQSNGFEIIASPKEMQPFLTDAKYYLCPISKGGGIKLRIMDGLKNGLIVIAHQKASRGYEEFIGKNMFVYSSASTFAQAVTDAQKCSFSRQQAVELYRSIFSFESGVGRLQKLLQSIK